MVVEQPRADSQFLMRRAIPIVACLFVWGMILWQAARIQPLVIAERTPAIRFVEYWAAGRLQLTGANPYDPDELFTLQKSVGLTRDYPEIMWNPPWTLFFVMPFGMLNYPVSRLLWFLFLFILVILCADWIWRFYGGAASRYWVAWALAFSFIPSLNALLAEEIPPLILLGVVAFLYFERRKKPWLAGASLVLIAVKPHLSYLFWIALLLWVVEKRKWSLIAAGIVSLFLATLIPLVFNPAAVQQYFRLYAIASPGPSDWATPTLGSALRLLFGLEKWWLGLVPPIAGTVWLLIYWRQQRFTWDWAKQMPLLLVVSMATTLFGWTGDQVVLLPALIQGALWILHSGKPSTFIRPILCYAATDSMAIVMNILGITALWYFWLAPMWLVTYVILLRRVQKERLGSLTR